VDRSSLRPASWGVALAGCGFSTSSTPPPTTTTTVRQALAGGRSDTIIELARVAIVPDGHHPVIARISGVDDLFGTHSCPVKLEVTISSAVAGLAPGK
jgi:hypothetical protein